MPPCSTESTIKKQKSLGSAQVSEAHLRRSISAGCA